MAASRAIWTIGVSALFAGLAVAACGGAAAPTATRAPAATLPSLATATKPAAAATATAAPITAPKAAPKGQLVWTSPWAQLVWDPHDQRSGEDADFFRIVLGSNLLRLGDADYEPNLLERWETSPDGKEYTFHLRRGVRWHNGDPVTTADLLYSWARQRRPEAKTVYTVQFATVASIEAVDDYTAKVRMKEVDPPWMSSLEIFFFVVPKKYLDTAGTQAFVDHPVGAGPFKYVQRAEGEFWRVEANTDYWDNAPSIQNLTHRTVKEFSTRLAVLKTGAADVITTVPALNAVEVEAIPGARVYWSPPSGTWVGHLDSRNPQSPFRDRRVRQAVNYGVDVDTIIKTIFQGRGVHVASVGIGAAAADPTVKAYPYDPVKAKALLKEAGYPDGFKGYFYARAATPEASAAEAVVNYLRQVGINLEIRLIEAGAFAVNMNEKKFPSPVIAVVSQGSAIPAYNQKAGYPRFVRTDGPWSLASVPEVDKLIDEGPSIVDARARQEQYAKLFRLAHEEAVSLFLWGLESATGLGPKVGQWPSGMGVKWNLVTLKP